jgi:hypothetical protein
VSWATLAVPVLLRVRNLFTKEILVVMNRISIDEFESYHSKRVLLASPPVTIKEIILSLLVAFVVTPFLFVTATVIPLMGQVTMALVVVLTMLYLYYRRSVIAAVASLGGAAIFTQLTFGTIQAIKYHIEVPMFIFTALGIPVCFLYSIFIVSRIWVLRGGAD